MGDFNGKGFASREEWENIVAPFYDNVEFEVVFINQEQLKPIEIDITGFFGGASTMDLIYANEDGTLTETLTINVNVFNPLDESISKTIFML